LFKTLGLTWLLTGLAFSPAAYEVIVLGDLHYDAPEFREQGAPGSEVSGGRAMSKVKGWQPEQTPAMLDAAAEQISPDTAFVVQLGDLVEGYSGNADVGYKRFAPAVAELKRRFPLPLYFVKGNNDAALNGGQAFDDIMLPVMSGEFKLDKPLETLANHALMHENDLYIFFDSIKPDVEFVERSLVAHPDARNVFFLTHYPVLPALRNQFADDIVLGRPDRSGPRRKLLKLLAGRNAIVLCGHIHQTTLTRYRDADGQITQLSNYSRITTPEAEFKLETVPSAEIFGTAAVMESCGKNDNFAQVIADYNGKYELYELILPGAGFNILRVEASGAYVEIHSGPNAKASATLSLR